MIIAKITVKELFTLHFLLSFTVSSLKFESESIWVHFCEWYKIGIQFHSLHVSFFPIITIYWGDYLFLTETFWLPYQIFVDYIYIVLFLSSQLHPIGVCIFFFCQNLTVLVIIALQYSLKWGSMASVNEELNI